MDTSKNTATGLCNLCVQLLKSEEEAAAPAAAATEAANLIDKEDAADAEAAGLEEELEDEQLLERQQLKRDLKGGSSLQPAAASSKQSYNNWFGRNDWSRRIQKVQGRIRFKNQIN